MIKRADHRAPHRALAAGERDAAEHDGGQRLEFPPHAGGRIRARLPRGVEDAARRAQRARKHIGEEQDQPDANAGVPRRLAAGADRGEVPAIARARQEDVADQENDEQVAALIGMPSTLPSPRKSQASLSTELVAKTCA